MLWFDNDLKNSLEIKVERAAAYYRNKYGKTPTLCFVHPSMLPEEKSNSKEGEQNKAYSTNGIEVRTSRSVLPNHFWIGVNGSPAAVPSR